MCNAIKLYGREFVAFVWHTSNAVHKTNVPYGKYCLFNLYVANLDHYAPHNMVIMSNISIVDLITSERGVRICVVANGPCQSSVELIN